MQIENHKEEVPFAHYAALFAAADPAEISARLNLPFDGGFTVKLLGADYTVTHPDAKITPALPIPTQTFLLRYLLEGKRVSWQGQWKTFREMPWGELYIQPYTGRVLTRAAYTLGTRIPAFQKAAEALGFQTVSQGDYGCQAELLPGYFMRICAWASDEEFPPSAQVLYSDNFAEGFAAEDRVVAGDILISALKAKY